jgi:hypothetical protein
VSEEKKIMAKTDIRISCDEDLKGRFDAFLEAQGMSRKDFLSMAIDCLSANPAPEPTGEDVSEFINEFADRKGEEFDRAAFASGFHRNLGNRETVLEAIGQRTWQQLKEGQDTRLDKLSALKEMPLGELQAFVKSNPQYKTLPGLGTLRLDKALDILMRHNESSTDAEDKFFIGAKSLMQVLVQVSGEIPNPGSYPVNRKSLDQWMEANQTKIARHNVKHKLTAGMNRGKRDYPVV